MQSGRKICSSISVLLLLFFFQPLVFAFEGYVPADTIKAHKLYTNALEKYKEGDFQEATELFDEAGKRFGKKRMWERAVECYLLEVNTRRMNADEEDLIDFFKQILSLSEEKLGAQHPLTAASYNRLGELYLEAHKHEMAGQSFQSALGIYSQGGNPDSLAMAKVYSNLCGLKMNLSQYDSAAIYIQHALDIQLASLDSLDLKLLPTYNTNGVLQYYLGNLDQAIYNFDKTLQIRLKAYGAEHYEVANSYNNLGSTYEKKKEFQRAVDIHQQALDIRRTALDSLHPNIALSLNNLGNAWYGLGEYEKSNEYHFEALRLRRKIYGENHRAIAMSYANIGHNLVLQDNPDKATYYFRKVIPVMIDLYGTDHLLTSDAYENLGLPFYYSGAYDSAFYYITKALRIREKIQDGINMSAARSYNNIGALYKENRDFELALSYYKKSAEIYKIFLGENCNPLAGSYNNMGEVYLETGENSKAYTYFKRSLDIDLANLGPDNPRLASRYMNLGAAAAAMGKHSESAACNKKALQLHVSAYGEDNRLAGSIYRNMAMDYVEMDSMEIALDYLNRAIDILNTFYGKQHFSLSSFYTERGLLLMELDESDMAHTNLYQGLMVNYKGKLDPDHLEGTDISKIIDKNLFIESLVAITRFNEAKYSADEQWDLLSKNLIIYQLIADISIKLRETYRLERSKLLALQKWDYLYTEGFMTAARLYDMSGEELFFNKAFRFAGLKKANALTDAILVAQAMENSGIPDSLIRLEKALHSSLEGNRQKLLEMDPSMETAEELASIEKEINSLNISLNELYIELEESYPEYNKLRSRYPQYMPDTIASMLDSGTLLLDFVVSDSSIYSIVIGKKGKWIERAAVPGNFDRQVNDLLRSVKKYRIVDFIATSEMVYHAVLSPLEKYFAEVEKIILIPDNYLLLLPFDILIKPDGATDHTDLVIQDYFIRRFETVTHYSTDLWIRSYQEHNSVNADNQASGFLGFAPVFDNYGSSEELILTDHVPFETDSSFASREVVDRLSLQGLPFSEREVDGLVSLFTQFGIEARGVLRAQATEEMFRASSGQFRYIHIATHGLINHEKPELSGLVFWKDSSDQADDSQQLLISEKANDGVIYTKEVYDLNINANLLTLSACETGAGLMAEGEGLLSFVRGFSYAGVPNMLISLWKVNDKTTVDLMLDFYKGVLSGNTYPAALRKAKLQAISRSNTSFPASWGNFVLIGY